MSKTMGLYDLHHVSYKSTYLRRQALLALGCGPSDEHYDISVAYAPGVAVVLDYDPAPNPGAEPIDRLVEARRRLDALIPDDFVAPAEKVRHTAKATVNGKLALTLPDEVQRWLRRWGRGQTYEVQLMVDQSGTPFVTMGLPAEKLDPNDPEIYIPLRPVRVERRCGSCDKGRMRATGVTLSSNPPQFPHTCHKCGASENLDRQYPYIKHEVDPSGF